MNRIALDDGGARSQPWRGAWAMLGLGVWIGLIASAPAFAGMAHAVSVPNALTLLHEDDPKLEQLQGEAMTPEAVGEWFNKDQWARVLVVRADILLKHKGDSRFQSIRQLLDPALIHWKERTHPGDYHRLLVVLDLVAKSELNRHQCDQAIDEIRSNEAPFVIVCSVSPAPTDGHPKQPTLADLVIKRLTQAGQSQPQTPLTLYDLLREVEASLPPDWPLVASVQLDWGLPIPGVNAADKLDAELTTLSAPGLSDEERKAQLKTLEESGVIVQHGEASSLPAVSVRITATSAAAARRLQRSRGLLPPDAVSAAFDNTLFTLVPVSQRHQLRDLASHPDVWTLSVNRPTTAPLSTP